MARLVWEFTFIFNILWGAEAPALFQIILFYSIRELTLLRFFKYYIYLELRKSFSFSLLKYLPVGGAVEGAIADGLGYMSAQDGGGDGFFGWHSGSIFEVGDGARHAQYAVESAC